MTLPLSIVVVAHDMARELPRTLATLHPDHQRGVRVTDYEVIVVDNGSVPPVEAVTMEHAGPRARLLRVDPAPPSPARAANTGVAAATGEMVGLIIDGARMASPGLLEAVLQARRLADAPIVATLGWHLGPVSHGRAIEHGYDQMTEDELLASVDWRVDGYELFAVSCLANSSGRGWFGPMGETSALFLPAATWHALGGLDERFDLPGGGLVNHDLYRRACALDDHTLVVLLGEGTFHQYHGGAATSGRIGWDEMHAQYVALRGEPHRPPERDPLYLGRVPPSSLEHLGRSVELAIARREKARRVR
jgi:glycosyltransferase involved in cell wall biosynthesis